MAKMTTDEECAVALLHDVIEDSEISAADLIADGIPAVVVEAVVCLTKHPDESYAQFIERVAKNSLARKIKIADIEDNINVLRLTSLTDKDWQRVQKYHQAWQRLQLLEVKT